MKKILSILMMMCLMIGSMSTQVFAKTTNEDVRAVWISTVHNLDYPSVKNNEAAQKSEFIQKLDELQAIGINTVVVQIRPKGDALYQSSINPWSDVLTGTQGKYPGYDPMAFMIEEAHKRGMAFHAWLNPYRVTTAGTDVNVLSSDHPARLNPSWTISYKDALYYNPELPEVKAHIVDTVEELVANYDVDAIHFDDYFYPSNYPLPTGEGKDGDVANSRREHINEMIRQVSEVIKKVDQTVMFGISPMGIWKNDLSDITGSSTGGSESYYSVAADTRTWIQNEWIDYVVPQIYWETGHKLADYETLVSWWSSEVEGTKVKLYIGQGIYKDIVANEITTQLGINQNYSVVEGSFYFSLRDLLNNRMGAKDQIADFYGGVAYPPINRPTLPEKPVLPDKVPEEIVSPQESIGKKGSVNTETLNVRSGARADRPVITKIGKGTRVAILDTLSGWYKVKLPDNQIGWVSAEYIKVDKTSTITQPTSKVGTVTIDGLNVRSGAGINNSVVTKVNKGTKVTLLETKGDWYKVKLLDGKAGWVSKTYITL
ncbi:MAG: family 10 glycosylhydrolase [Cellulosilyticaceae bacterium]